MSIGTRGARVQGVVIALTLVVGLIVGVSIGHDSTRAQGSMPELPEGATGVTAAVLGVIQPAAAPGYDLQLFRSEWAPGSSISLHTHPGALVSCIESGSVSFAIQSGMASVVRAHGPQTPAAAETISPNQPITYGPGDCVTFDQDAANTAHIAWNDGTEPAVIWEAHLYKTGAKASTFTNEQGTPAP
jgi:hypothetical protein